MRCSLCLTLFCNKTLIWDIQASHKSISSHASQIFVSWIEHKLSDIFDLLISSYLHQWNANLNRSCILVAWETDNFHMTAYIRKSHSKICVFCGRVVSPCQVESNSGIHGLSETANAINTVRFVEKDRHNFKIAFRWNALKEEIKI